TEMLCTGHVEGQKTGWTHEEMAGCIVRAEMIQEAAEKQNLDPGLRAAFAASLPPCCVDKRVDERLKTIGMSDKDFETLMEQIRNSKEGKNEDMDFETLMEQIRNSKEGKNEDI